MSELIARIEELESKIAFQEDTIEKMSTEMAAQQQSIYELEVKIRYLADKQKSDASSNIAALSEETPPPHY
jgi:SlyX protein